jgi:hypothetical protein
MRERRLEGKVKEVEEEVAEKAGVVAVAVVGESGTV